MCLVLRSDRPGFLEGSDPEDRATGVPYPLPSWSTFSHTSHPYRRGQSAVPLETWLVQKRVYHRSVSPSLSWERATLRFWPATYMELEDNSLHCVHTAEATTRQHSICSCAVRLTCKHAPPLTTPTPPTHDAWWASWRRMGRWHVPPTGNEREREYLTQWLESSWMRKLMAMKNG